MEKISRLTTIINAFTGDLPEGAPWYEERLKECLSCEHNSINKDGSSLKIQNIICSDKGHCTLCGCCVDKKSAMKESVCALKDKGHTPKWEALAIITKGEDWDIENLSPHIGTIDMTEEAFIYKLKSPLKKEGEVRFTVGLSSNKNKIMDIAASCGCTSPQFKEVNKGVKRNGSVWKVSVTLDLSRVSGKFTKNVYISYKDAKGSRQKLVIKLKGEN